MLKLNLKYSKIEDKNIMKYREKVRKIHNELHEMLGKEGEFARMVKPSYKFR